MINEMVMVLFQTARGGVMVVVGLASERDELVEKAIRAGVKVIRSPWLMPANGDGGENSYRVYDGEHPYDADTNEPDYLGIVDVRPLVLGQVEAAA